MLLQLTINNFALIEKASLDFKEGFTILSGETGAGKSILIDAINYVQGSKFNKDLIRTGEEKTFVEAIFSIDDNERLKEILDDLEIEYDDTLIISRETFINGRSNIKVNGRSIIVATLKKISSTLLDIHGQHNNQNLLNKENHIMYLDDFGDSKLSEDLKEYGEKFSELKDIERKISELSNEGKDEKLLNYLEYQLNEIEEAKLRNGEEEELTERFNVLSNAEKIKNSLGISYNLLNGIESSVVDSLSVVNRELSNVEEHLEKIKNINSKIMEMYYEIQEMAREIRTRNNDDSLIETLINICKNYLKIKEIDKCEKQLEEIYHILKDDDIDGRIECNLIKYRVYTIKDELSEAEDVLVNTYKLSKNTDKLRKAGELAIMVGKFYIDHKNDTQAAKYLDEGVSIFKELGILQN